MLWASRLSEDDYKDALKLWENRTVIPSIDADVLKCAMDRFECLHEMEVKVFSSSCLESVVSNIFLCNCANATHSLDHAGIFRST